MWATAFSKALASPDLDAYDVGDCFPPSSSRLDNGLMGSKMEKNGDQEQNKLLDFSMD